MKMLRFILYTMSFVFLMNVCQGTNKFHKSYFDCIHISYILNIPIFLYIMRVLVFRFQINQLIRCSLPMMLLLLATQSKNLNNTRHYVKVRR